MKATGTDTPTLIYIAGYGRSGSTLLDTFLGNHADIFGAGELNGLFWKTLNPAFLCSCGEPVARCAFWKQVTDHALAATPDVDCRKAAAVTSRLEPLFGSSRGKDAYFSAWKAAIKGISGVSGKKLIIDSSKSCRPTHSRLALFARGLGLPVKAIHMVRDPRGVMWSCGRGNFRRPLPGSRPRTRGSMVRGFFGWLWANVAAEDTFRRVPQLPVLRLKYENLVEHPVETLEQIGSFLDRDMNDLVRIVRDASPFQAGHGIGGNRMRRQQQRLALRPDFEWTGRLPLAHKAMAALAWPLIRRYGYPLRLPATPTAGESQKN